MAPRTICYLIKKAENKWWPRLLKSEGKLVFLKVDWDKWQDEDDEDIGSKSWLNMFSFPLYYLVQLFTDLCYLRVVVDDFGGMDFSVSVGSKIFFGEKRKCEQNSHGNLCLQKLDMGGADDDDMEEEDEEDVADIANKGA